MNIKSQSPRSNINWKKIAIVAVMLGIAGFQYIQKQRNNNDQDAGRNGGTAQIDQLPGDFDLDGQLDKSGQSGQGFKASDTQQSTSNKPYLSDGERGKKLSPGGLVYNSSRREHRTEHVLRHASDMPSRPGNHGVFDANGDDVFRLIDEAYKMIQSNSRQVSKDQPRAGEEYKTAYTIDMKRRIGYRGGKSGNRDGKPAVTKIKLVIANGNQVITAYPL